MGHPKIKSDESCMVATKGRGCQPLQVARSSSSWSFHKPVAVRHDCSLFVLFCTDELPTLFHLLI